MKLVQIAIYTLFITFFANNAFAGCDPCIQVAAETANAAMSTSLQTLNSTARKTDTSVQTLKQTIESSNQTLTGLMQNQSQQLMTSLGAATNRQELSTHMVSKTIEKSTDVITSTIVQTFKDANKLSQIQYTADLYSMEKAQPISGTIAGARAPYLKEALKQRREVVQKNDLNFYNWLNLKDETDTSEGQRASLSAVKITKLMPYLVGLNKTAITEDEVEKLTELMRLIVNPSPAAAPKIEDVLSGGQASVDKELARVKSTTKDALIFSVISRILTNKAPLLKTDEWKTGYIAVNETEPSLTSIDEMYEAETTRKLLSEAWLTDIMQKTEASALREQAYQNNLNNILTAELIKQEQQTLLLLAMMALK